VSECIHPSVHAELYQPYVHVDARSPEAWRYDCDEYHARLFPEAAKDQGRGESSRHSPYLLRLLVAPFTISLADWMTMKFMTLIRTPSVAKHF